MANCRDQTYLILTVAPGVLELLLELLGIFLGDAGLDLLGGRLDQVLGLLEAQARGRAHHLDDVDLVGADRLEHHVELGLRRGGLGRRGGSARAT